MPERGIAMEGTTVVVRGAFNPAIFTPSWFRSQDLVGDLEIEDQQIEIITRDIAVFQMGWLKCHVTGEGLQLSTTVPEEFERLRDAAIGVLRLLRHTPISALGINRDSHTRVDSVESWHAIGDAITPKDIWSDILELPGVLNVTMRGIRPDEWGGQVNIQVEPSHRYPQSVYVSTNDHFTLALAEQKPTTREHAWVLSEQESEMTADKIEVAVAVLLEYWPAVLERAERARAKVVGLGGLGA